MSTLSITVRDNKKQFLPGDTITGAVAWQISQEVEALELRLIWFTSGKGTTDVSVENVQRFPQPALVGNSAFSFVLPSAPHSFSGNLISLTWALELVATRGDDATRWEFVMAPGGTEIVLPKGDDSILKKLPPWLRGKMQARLEAEAQKHQLPAGFTDARQSFLETLKKK